MTASVTNKILADKMTGLEQKITSLDNAVRGHNGEVGIQAELLILKRTVVTTEKFTESISEIKSLVSSLTKAIEKQGGNGKVDDKPSEKSFGTWAWFRDTYLDKIIFTVLTVIITTILIYGLQHIFVGP
jgi:hypothetical protein